jgi:predicted ester cyclase
MSTENENLAQVRRFYAAFNAHDIPAALSHFAETVLNHGFEVTRIMMGAVYQDILTRFPDARIDSQEMVAAGASVISRDTYSGTHKGIGRLPIDGGQMVGVAATGKHFTAEHIHWYTLKDGLIVEHRATRDDVGMLVQLGLLPKPLPFSPPSR